MNKFKATKNVLYKFGVIRPFSSTMLNQAGLNKSPYDTLKLSKFSSEEDIKNAYKKLVKESHPDTNPNDQSLADKFKEIQQAYDFLSDSKKKSAYDSELKGPATTGTQQTSQSQQSTGYSGHDFSYEDFLRKKQEEATKEAEAKAEAFRKQQEEFRNRHKNFNQQQRSAGYQSYSQAPGATYQPTGGDSGLLEKLWVPVIGFVLVGGFAMFWQSATSTKTYSSVGSDISRNQKTRVKRDSDDYRYKHQVNR